MPHGNAKTEEDCRGNTKRYGRHILQRAATEGGLKGILISVTKVSVTTDLSIAKVYLSIFPTKSSKELLEGIQSNQPLIKHELAQRTRASIEESA